MDQGYRQTPERKDATDEVKKVWKTTHNNNITHVCSPIASNYKNLKQEFSSSLK